jgi:hypothetical protein
MSSPYSPGTGPGHGGGLPPGSYESTYEADLKALQALADKLRPEGQAAEGSPSPGQQGTDKGYGQQPLGMTEDD